MRVLLPSSILVGFEYWVKSFDEEHEWGAAAAPPKEAKPFLQFGKESSVLLD